jgi:hypothetical protein
VLATTSYQAARYQDTPRRAVSGIDLGQAVVAVLGVLAIGNEYSTDMMCTTLTAMPRRLVMLGAKAAERRARRLDRHLEALFGLGHLGVDAAQVGQEVGGELVAGLGDRSGGLQAGQGADGLSCGTSLLGCPPATWSHSTERRRHTTWVRRLPRSRRRLDHSLSTAAGLGQRRGAGPWIAERPRPPSGRRWGRSC